MAFSIPARKAKPAVPAAPGEALDQNAQRPSLVSPVQSAVPAVVPKTTSPMQQAAMSSLTQPGTQKQPAVKAGVSLPAGVGSPASSRAGMLTGGLVGNPGAPQSPPPSAAPASSSSEAVGAQGDAEMEQLLNDMYALNDKTGADIKQAGQDRFGAMQRAAMAASSRFGGGVGGAVLSTQGDMLQQANRGIADALLANSGQRQNIMGNALSMKHGDYRDDLGYARGLEGKNADLEGDLNSQDLATSIKGAQNQAASAMKQQGSGDPLAGVVNDQQMQGLFDAIGAAKTPEEARAALDALNAALAEKHNKYQSEQAAALQTAKDKLNSDPGSLSDAEIDQLVAAGALDKTMATMLKKTN